MRIQERWRLGGCRAPQYSCAQADARGASACYCGRGTAEGGISIRVSIAIGLADGSRNGRRIAGGFGRSRSLLLPVPPCIIADVLTLSHHSDQTLRRSSIPTYRSIRGTSSTSCQIARQAAEMLDMREATGRREPPSRMSLGNCIFLVFSNLLTYRRKLYWFKSINRSSLR